MLRTRMGGNWVPTHMRMGIQEQVCPLLSTGMVLWGVPVPGISIPKAKPASPRACLHQLRTAMHSAMGMGRHKLFSGMVRVKKKTPNHRKKPAGMPEEED